MIFNLKYVPRHDPSVILMSINLYELAAVQFKKNYANWDEEKVSLFLFFNHEMKNNKQRMCGDEVQGEDEKFSDKKKIKIQNEGILGDNYCLQPTV